MWKILQDTWPSSFNKQGFKKEKRQLSDQRRYEISQQNVVCGPYLHVDLNKPATKRCFWDNQGKVSISQVLASIRNYLVVCDDVVVIVFKSLLLQISTDVFACEITCYLGFTPAKVLVGEQQRQECWKVGLCGGGYWTPQFYTHVAAHLSGREDRFAIFFKFPIYCTPIPL